MLKNIHKGEKSFIVPDALQSHRAIDFAQHIIGWTNPQLPGFFYGKWTGTINILEKGKYVFDLDLGFDTSSSIKIDGQANGSVASRGVFENRSPAWNAVILSPAN